MAAQPGSLPPAPTGVTLRVVTVVQIFGTKKSADTRKALRFFKERGIRIDFRDLSEKGISRGELERVASSVGTDDLIDEQSALYKSRGFQYMEYDPIEEILESPLLIRMPVVRFGKSASVGADPETWELWAREIRNG